MKNDSLGNRFKLSWDIRRKYPLAASDTPPAPPPTAHRAGARQDRPLSENRADVQLKSL